MSELSVNVGVPRTVIWHGRNVRTAIFYFTVLKEGNVGTGDSAELLSSDSDAVPVFEITRLYLAKHYGPAEVGLATRVMQMDALPHSWKEYFSERLRPASLRSNT